MKPLEFKSQQKFVKKYFFEMQDELKFYILLFKYKFNFYKI